MLARAYDRLILMLAALASILVVAIFMMIVIDVVLRTVGARPPAFTSALSEYALLYMTMLAAPWLVRERGHVRIDSFLGYAPVPVQKAIERLIIVVCIVLCVIATYYSARFAIDFWMKGTVDIRSITIPRSFLFVPLVLGFFLCGVEFMRLLVRGERLKQDEGEAAASFEGEI